MLIIFDQLSTKSKQKKISTSTVNEIKIDEEHSYIFCANEKIVIYDIIRNEEIQALNVKNEEKLHEKVRKFILYEGNIITYGTYIRVFDQFVDESLQHEKRKMKTIYTWRLNKLQKTTKQYAITN
jgi:CRISPR/Cas system-associated protein endoribonuclease Cas2